MPSRRHRLPDALRALVRRCEAERGADPVVTEQQIETVLGPALSLVWAVREMEPAGVQECFSEVANTVPDELSAARAMAVVLAAMVPDDVACNHMLAWMHDPAEYRRLRSAGFAAELAADAVSAGRKKRD